MAIQLQLLQKITNDFSEERKLGSGAYGKVYKGVHENGEEIAVKKLSDMPGLDNKQFQNELTNLMQLKHPNTVKFVGFCSEMRHEPFEHNGKIVLAEKWCRLLCLEYLQNGSLDKHISDGLDWHTCYKIIKGICNGLKYLHDELKPPIYHLDLKPGNILLDQNMVPKIADFGSSELFGGEQTQMTNRSIGTRGYIPPEYITRNIISNKSDIFSLGIIIQKIMLGADYSDSYDKPSQEVIQRALSRYPSLEVLEREQVIRCIEIALKCVDPDRHKRPTIGRVIHALNHIQIPIHEAMAESAPAVEEYLPARKLGVPVFVIMPQDTIKICCGSGLTVDYRKTMARDLAELKRVGVEGVVVDVWWGVVEGEEPEVYNFAGYMELMEMARKTGLKVQAVMSFHQCGGNVGDSVTIPLPRWVVEEMEKDQDLAYTDQWGRRNYEYVSLGCDAMPVLKGRTPVQCYTDFMRAFRDHFASFLGNTIVEIQVGMGPAGELRYPSYPMADKIWEFPCIGAFQCYDEYMKGSLKVAAEAAGKPEWGSGGPTDAGSYKSWPDDTGFFRQEGGGWSIGYGDFFLSWYSKVLLDHGDRVLSGAASVFGGHSRGIKLSVKVAGIHWHYGTSSHAAELTAGYYNTRHRNGYLPIAHMLARHGAVLNFTCVEKRDHDPKQPQGAQCRPETLVWQVASAARDAGIGLAGQNAEPLDDEAAYDQVVAKAAEGAEEERMVAFTLRMGPKQIRPDNLRRFAEFVERMSGAEREAVRTCNPVTEESSE